MGAPTRGSAYGRWYAKQIELASDWKKSALLLVDGLLDKAGYEVASSQAQADPAAAESELGRLRAVRHDCTLPPLEMVLASAAGWSAAARASPVPAQRNVLAGLIKRTPLTVACSRLAVTAICSASSTS